MPARTVKLALFDIDGTILNTQGTGRVSVEAAISRALGRDIPADGVSFSGKTDRQIIREILIRANMAPAEIDDAIERIVAAFLYELPRRLDPSRVLVLPGVRELIADLAAAEDVVLGLLTGNLEETAYHKLASVDLEEYFRFGAFGSDHEDRNRLPEIAMERARQTTGQRIDPSDVFVIGDTVHDIACGRAGGCRTIAVCTGRYTCDALRAQDPDLLVDDFSDYRSVVSFITSSRDASSAA